MNIISGDLLQMAREGNFDVIAHGCNCHNIMGAGIARQIKEQFLDAFKMDAAYYAENHTFPYMMMGNYSQFFYWVDDLRPTFTILNLYTQLAPGISSPGFEIPLDYTALTVALRKVNERFKGKRIGLPWIGCGLAGGDKSIVRNIVENTLTDMVVTIVEYENNKSSRGSMVATGLGYATGSREVYNNISAQGDGGRDLAADNGGGVYDEPLSDDFTEAD